MAPPDCEPGSAPEGERRLLLGPWVAVLLGVLCYANSLPNGFVYDDTPLILNNPRIRTLTDWRGVWLSNWWETNDELPELATRHDRLYRPLTLLSLALNYAAVGDRPLVYHLVNVLLHAAVCGLVWDFARRLTGDRAIASAGAALFAVHPIHVEAVANVVGRAESLTALFLLAGTVALLPGGGGLAWRRVLLAAGLFLAALLSKEAAVCYPALVALALLARPPDRPVHWRGWLGRGLVLLLPLAVYFPLRYAALGGHLLRDAPADVMMNPLVLAPPAQRLFAAFTILGHYTRLLIVPQKLSADYGLAIVDPERGFEPLTLVGLLAALALCAGLIGFARRGGPGRHVAILAAMFIASYVLVSNSIVLIGVAVAERLLYWPSVPALLLAAVGIVEFWRRQCAPGKALHARAGLLRALGVCLLATLALRTALRNVDWRSNLELFAQDTLTYPQGAHLRNCYATALLLAAQSAPPEARRALCAQAREQLDAALRVSPDYVDSLVLRGKARAELRDVAGATLDLQRALLIAPTNRAARETLDKLTRRSGAAQQQLAALAAAVEHAPDSADQRLAYAAALVEYGRYEEALAQLQRAVTLVPTSVEAHSRLGQALALLDKREEAIAEFQRVLELSPDDWQAHVNLSALLAQRDPQHRDPAEILRHARRGYELAPDDLRAVGNLAEAYALNGQPAEALQLYRQLARRLDQNDPFVAIIHERIRRLEQEQ